MIHMLFVLNRLVDLRTFSLMLQALKMVRSFKETKIKWWKKMLLGCYWDYKYN